MYVYLHKHGRHQSFFSPRKKRASLDLLDWIDSSYLIPSYVMRLMLDSVISNEGCKKRREKRERQSVRERKHYWMAVSMNAINLASKR